MRREYTDAYGKKRLRSDEELAIAYLEGYVDYYSGGQIEHMQSELENLKRNTAKALLAIGGDSFIKFIESE